MYDVFRKKSLFAGSILGRVIFCTHHVIHTWCVYYIATKNIVCSREWFRSTDLWVMGPARFLCATLLKIRCPILNSNRRNNGNHFFKEKPSERFELSTPGLQDQCSNH